MIQIRLILFGVTVVATLGYAIYNHYQNRRHENSQQQHSYGPQRPRTDEYFTPTPTGNSSSSERPRKRRKGGGVPDTCSICLELVGGTISNTRNLLCGHAFHEKCIEVWMQTQKTCPNCRTTI